MTQTVADRIAQELADRVIDGRLQAGVKLRQDVFAHEFGASQVAVREAFRQLEIQRLAVREPRKGVRVAPLPSGGEQEILAMRVALEGLALRSLTVRPGVKHLARIEMALEAGDRAQGAVEWEAANRAFHVSLAWASGMSRLIASVRELNIASSRHALAVARPARWKPRSNHDHRRIFDALRAGEIDQAVVLLEHHLKAAERASHV